MGLLANTLPTQTLETHSKPKQTWIISGTNLSEESVNQVKEENQANISKRRVPKYFEFWKNVVAATIGDYLVNPIFFT